MATPLGIVFSTAENQVSQCDEQTFGSNSEFEKAGAARASLAKSSRKVSAETGKALRTYCGFLAQRGSMPAAQVLHSREPDRPVRSKKI